jgi:hypothetical protein
MNVHVELHLLIKILSRKSLSHQNDFNSLSDQTTLLLLAGPSPSKCAVLLQILHVSLLYSRVLCVSLCEFH